MRTLENYRWTDNSINIDDFYDSLPKMVREIVDACEKADAEDDWSYPNLCESLENVAKQYVVAKIITKEQWDKLCCRYYGG